MADEKLELLKGVPLLAGLGRREIEEALAKRIRNLEPDGTL